jgi:SAM-dependent methyltransferase
MRLPKNWNEFIQSANIDVRYLWEADLVKIIMESIKEGVKSPIIEIGCSKGRYLTMIGDAIGSADRIGIDMLPCNTLPGMSFVRGNAIRLPFKEGTFEVTMSFGLLEHFETSIRMRIINEQIRILRKGGIIITFIPNCTIGSLRFLMMKMLDWRREFKHLPLGMNSLKNELASAGVEILQDRYLGTSLHVGPLSVKSKKLFVNNAIFADDIIIVGRRM